MLLGLLVATGASPAGAQVSGSLEATVTLREDSFPGPTVVVNSTDPEVCGREHTLRDFVVSDDNRGVRYVVASLIDVPEEQIPERTPKRVVIDNRNCQFHPHAAVAVVGDTVVARNSDPTLHNTHYYGPLRSNIALAGQGMTASRPARRSGLVTVLCDVHGWMKAFIRIDPHPFHDVTDAQGRFRIDGVPPGVYTLELWHERLGPQQVEVRIEAGRVATVNVVYPLPTD